MRVRVPKREIPFEASSPSRLFDDGLNDASNARQGMTREMFESAADYETYRKGYDSYKKTAVSAKPAGYNYPSASGCW